ncbi:uroporphyrinogen-III synthase [Mariprofundus sp. NF]|uniref:uroporphyrinogen-III synthase n=1 Tax=Mariprofundus sp. NF TaxID=2608716 RepID=UPI0015A34972|nr:uroporphyrinogen-III synthase [Mariprofundus sp. NF]NWF38839.1 uroporphyrinogen-III synthase [Mariprofundus sp. NF]
MDSSALEGKRILLTRAAHQLGSIETMVRACAAVPIPFPCLELQVNTDALKQGIAMLPEFSDLLFTSANGVLALASFCHEHNRTLKSTLADKRIAAVGAKTAAALTALDISVDIIPEIASQDGLITAYSEHGMPEQLLFFRAEEGRERLAEVLEQQEIVVKTVKAYRTICPDDDAGKTVALLEAGEIDAVLLGSTKTARHYLQRIGSSELANRPVVVAISKLMAEETEQLGLHVQVVAKSASFDSMLAALSNYFESNS